MRCPVDSEFINEFDSSSICVCCTRPYLLYDLHMYSGPSLDLHRSFCIFFSRSAYPQLRQHPPTPRRLHCIYCRFLSQLASFCFFCIPCILCSLCFFCILCILCNLCIICIIFTLCTRCILCIRNNLPTCTITSFASTSGQLELEASNQTLPEAQCNPFISPTISALIIQLIVVSPSPMFR